MLLCAALLLWPGGAAAQEEQETAHPDFLRLSHVIELDNDTYINTISRIEVSREGDLLLLDPHRSEAYLLPALSEEPGDAGQAYTADPVVPLAYDECGMEAGFSPYAGEFAGAEDIIIYNLHGRPLLFDEQGNCRARLSYPSAGELKRRYAEVRPPDSDTTAVRGIWTHEITDANEHFLRYRSFRRIRSEERRIELPEMQLPVMNSYQNGGGLFMHQPSEKLFLIGASSAHVYEVPLSRAAEASAAEMRVHEPDYPEYRQNPEDLEAGLPPSRRIPNMVRAIQAYGFVETAYRLDEDHLLLSYRRQPQQQPQQLDDDGLPVGTPPPQPDPVSLLMLFDMQEGRFAGQAFSMPAGTSVTGTGNGFVYIARRSEEASLQRGLINPLIYVYELAPTK